MTIPCQLPKFLFSDTTGRLTDETGHINLLQWWWQNGDFINHLTGEVSLSEHLRSLPPDEHEAAVPADMAKLFPQLLIDTNFPLTMLIHGDADTAVVLASKSEYTYEELQKAGIHSMLHIVPGAGHGLMVQPGIKPAPQAEGLYKQAFEFLAKEIT